MIRIAIVEDEDSYVQVLTGYLKQYETEHSLSFQISVFHDGLDIVSEYKADYDIILLDIQMKHLDGMKTAEKIRELDEDVSFIFITSTIQFAVQGYLVDALGYVVKPVAYLAFSQILGKAVKKVKQKQQKRLYDDRSGRRTDAPGYQSDLLHRKPAPQHSVPYRKRGFSHCRSNEKGGSAFKRQRIFQMP